MKSIPIADIKELFSNEETTLPDGCVDNVDTHVRQGILDEIAKSGWKFELDNQTTTLPSAAELFAGERRAVINLWLSEKVVVDIFHWDPDTFDFQFDISEVDTQADLDAICEFVRLVGTASQSHVQLRWEGRDIAFYTYDPVANEFLK